jgi:eukaryotic-like serine/threonine-protein kinase
LVATHAERQRPRCTYLAARGRHRWLSDNSKTVVGGTLRLCAEACRALDVLHRHDIIHRDVTPGNLLLSRTGNGGTHVLIADLGVAKSTLDAVGATVTAGTPSYMAPEQAMGVTPLDSRADIYSLTAVTYAMLTGHPPFLVRSIADILARDPSQTPEPIAERLGAPSTLDGVMPSGLAADRNRRPPKALLLADALKTIAEQMDPSGSPTQAPDGIVMTHPSTQAGPPRAGEITVAKPPGTALDPSFFPPPSVRTPGFESATPYPAPVGSPAFQPLPQLAGSYRENSYARRHLTTPPVDRTPSRPVAYYILLAVTALALFAVSMFLTILVLS